MYDNKREYERNKGYRCHDRIYHNTDQPLNRSKTEALFSARAIGLPKFNITFNPS
jgi:hypothetical protein